MLEPESEYENALFRQIRHWKKEVERLRAELAERDENAERYLWLRANWDRVATRVECDNAATRVVHIELLDRRSYRPLDVGSLDAALDEARKGEETQ